MKPQELNHDTQKSFFYSIKEEDLPLCCPKNGDDAWDNHPRVYLPIEKTGRTVCPYCHTTYHLTKELT